MIDKFCHNICIFWLGRGVGEGSEESGSFKKTKNYFNAKRETGLSATDCAV